MESKKQYNIWKEKYVYAKENMLRNKQNQGVLIEVAAQHPLVNGEYPNEEFQKRLCLAIELYKQKKRMDEPVKIYVPGSIHMDEGLIDKISLSEAGKNFLISKGISSDDIFAEDMNRKFKGDEGVYNSADECFVACEIYKELDYRELHCVCSSAQMMRKVLCYIHFGFVPYMHTVSCDEMFHSYIDEMFINIPILLEDNDALQGESKEAKRLRDLRKPI